jgi:AbrB family looped-hinge helix DNA binding protein
METVFTVVSSKGQVVIPAALREKLGIKPGTRIAVQQDANRLILEPITDEYIASLVGCCKGEDSLVEAREREHSQEE